MIEVIDHKYDQQFRSLLASLEILAAAAVSNALVLGSFIRDKGAKKKRWRHQGASLSGQSSQDQRPPGRRMLTQQNWGSDADLAGDLGITCTESLREKEPEMSRPAPIALPTGKDAKNLTPLPRHQADPDEAPQIKVNGAEEPSFRIDVDAIMPSTPSKAAFFDIGGLLSDDETNSRPKQHPIAGPQSQNFSRPLSPRNGATGRVSRPSVARTGSDTFLEDVGGLLSTSDGSSNDRPTAKPRGMSLVDVLRETGPDDFSQPQRHRPREKVTTPEIQDAGGLLG